LRIINEKPVILNEKINIAFIEANELIAIFTTSISTAKKNHIS